MTTNNFEINQEKPPLKTHQKLIRIVFLVARIQFWFFFVALITSLVSLINGSIFKETLHAIIVFTISLIYEIFHYFMGKKYFKYLRLNIHEDAPIHAFTILESFLFANILGLILTIIAKSKQQNPEKH